MTATLASGPAMEAVSTEDFLFCLISRLGVMRAGNIGARLCGRIGREQTTFHESAHVCVAYLYGIHIESATVVPNRSEGTLGQVVLAGASSDPPLRRRGSVLNDTRKCLLVLYGRPGFESPWAARKFLRTIDREIKSLLTDAWPLVRFFAQELMSRSSLGRDEISRLLNARACLGLAFGTIPAPVFRYRGIPAVNQDPDLEVSEPELQVEVA